MLRSKASRLFSLAVLCGGFVFSQSVSSHGQAAKFSSLYSNLKTDCKAAVRLKKGENGRAGYAAQVQGLWWL